MILPRHKVKVRRRRPRLRLGELFIFDQLVEKNEAMKYAQKDISKR